MTREELGTLVSQLDQLNATLARYQSIDQACAEGYFAVSEQNPNMGIHMASGRYHEDGVFDPAKPEMLLFAKPGGEKLKKQELGQCRKGVWTGDKDFQVVGAAYMLPTEDFGDRHPEGFAGSIDNWHVHYHSCLGVNMDLILTREQCEAMGGRIVPKAGWMIHAYAAPGFDNQLGVFSMWNPTIPPLVDGSGMEGSRQVAAEPPPVGAAATSIHDFVFPTIEVKAGQPVVITNSDVVPHTVTAGIPMQPNGEFDSGAISTGQSFTKTFDEPGEHPFYCIYHPFMQGKVVVKE
jgi:plastocyanin